jgi:hypothetical protein
MNERLEKKIHYINELDNYLDYHRHYGIDALELLIHVAMVLGFKIKKTRKNIIIKRWWETFFTKESFIK